MILGLAGYARSGKDTVAEYLVEKYGFVRMAFADPMREALLRLDPNINLAGMSVPLSMAVRGMGWETLKEDSQEVRQLLQRMGTEVGREMFGEHFWVDYAINAAVDSGHERIVFSDVRFPNEVSGIKSFEGNKVWHIDRPGVTPANDHISEHALDNHTFDLYITNAHTKEHLYDAVDMLIRNILG